MTEGVSAAGARAFRGVVGQFTTGVALVIAVSDGEPHAATAGSFVVASFEPPLVAVFFAGGSRMAAYLAPEGRFSLNILAAADFALARRFARPGRPTGWEALTGIELVQRDPAPPVLAGAVAWLDCAVREVTDVGDHQCVVAEALAMARQHDAAALVYHRGRFHRLGRAVAPAPWLELDPADLTSDW